MYRVAMSDAVEHSAPCDWAPAACITVTGLQQLSTAEIALNREQLNTLNIRALAKV